MIDRILDKLDEAEALKQTDAEGDASPTQTVAITLALPPMVEVLSGTDLSASSPSVMIKVKGHSAADAPVTSWPVRVNGQDVPYARGLQRDQTERELGGAHSAAKQRDPVVCRKPTRCLHPRIGAGEVVRQRPAPHAIAAVPASTQGGAVAATASAGF